MAKSLIPKSKAKTAYGLLSEIRALILAEPLRYSQRWWLMRDGKAGNFEKPQMGYPNCGTVGCVAGWVVSVTRKRVNDSFEVEEAAQRILGLENWIAGELFTEDAVPSTIQPQTQAHAEAGARHIARFQKKYRAQLLAKKV